MALPVPVAAAGPAAGPIKARKRPVWLIVLLAVSIQGVVIAFFLTSASGGSTQGEIRSTGAPHGDFLMAPPSCHSGEHESFFGVWVAPELEEIDGRTGFRGGLKVMKNPVGQWEAYLENPRTCQGFACQVLKVEAQHCKTFDLEVENSGVRVNDIRLRRGHAHLDCTFPQGGTLKANLQFSGCN